MNHGNRRLSHKLGALSVSYRTWGRLEGLSESQKLLLVTKTQQLVGSLALPKHVCHWGLDRFESMYSVFASLTFNPRSNPFFSKAINLYLTTSIFRPAKARSSAEPSNRLDLVKMVPLESKLKSSDERGSPWLYVETLWQLVTDPYLAIRSVQCWRDQFVGMQKSELLHDSSLQPISQCTFPHLLRPIHFRPYTAKVGDCNRFWIRLLSGINFESPSDFKTFQFRSRCSYLAVAFSFGTVFERNFSLNGSLPCLFECIYLKFSVELRFRRPGRTGIHRHTSCFFYFPFSFHCLNCGALYIPSNLIPCIVYALLFAAHSVNSFYFQTVHLFLFDVFVLQFFHVPPFHLKCWLSVVLNRYSGTYNYFY